MGTLAEGSVQHVPACTACMRLWLLMRAGFRGIILCNASAGRSMGSGPDQAHAAAAQIQSQKRKAGILAPKRFVQRLKRDNELFRSYMHQARARLFWLLWADPQPCMLAFLQPEQRSDG